MSILRFKTSRELYNEPVTIKSEPCTVSAVRCTSCGREFPAVYADGAVTAILNVPAGEYEFETVEGGAAPTVTFGSMDGDRFDVLIGGKKFTSYVYDPALAKPYLGPVMTSFGESFTRLDFETKEHPHHRSIFFGVGDVTLDGGAANIDFWNEPANCGIQRHAGIENVTENNVFAAFTAKTTWCSHDGAPMIDAACEYKFYDQPEGVRYIDLALTYTASYGEVTFGKTKEAGPLGVRMADPLRAERGGYIANSYGARGEGECWGRAANWCVYGGELSGHRVGIAVFDDPKNERYPTTWHIRDYGLFAANNLYFRGGFKIGAGESLTYRYRIVLFEGEADGAHIGDRFITYAK